MKERAPGIGDGQDEFSARDFVDWASARKASFSWNNGDCVELASGNGCVGFQDSKQKGMPDTDRTRLVFKAGAAATFLADVKNGVYDL